MSIITTKDGTQIYSRTGVRDSLWSSVMAWLATTPCSTASRRFFRDGISPKISRSSTCQRSFCTAIDDQIRAHRCLGRLLSSKIVKGATLKVYPGGAA